MQSLWARALLTAAAYVSRALQAPVQQPSSPQPQPPVQQVVVPQPTSPQAQAPPPPQQPGSPTQLAAPPPQQPGSPTQLPPPPPPPQPSSPSQTGGSPQSSPPPPSGRRDGQRTDVDKLFVGQIPKTLEEDGVREGTRSLAALTHARACASRAPPASLHSARLFFSATPNIRAGRVASAAATLFGLAQGPVSCGERRHARAARP